MFKFVLLNSANEKDEYPPNCELIVRILLESFTLKKNCFNQIWSKKYQIQIDRLRSSPMNSPIRRRKFDAFLLVEDKEKYDLSVQYYTKHFTDLGFNLGMWDFLAAPTDFSQTTDFFSDLKKSYVIVFPGRF
jgi:hypothetical protein